MSAAVTPEQFAAELSAAGRSIARDLRPVLLRGAVGIKRAWSGSIKGVQGSHVTRAAGTIAFDDPRLIPSGIEVEVGPHERYAGTGQQRGLVGILEFGTATSRARLFGQDALDDEALGFSTWVGKRAADVIEGDA